MTIGTFTFEDLQLEIVSKSKNDVKEITSNDDSSKGFFGSAYK